MNVAASYKFLVTGYRHISGDGNLAENDNDSSFVL
jgi:hypothetical protein